MYFGRYVDDACQFISGQFRSIHESSTADSLESSELAVAMLGLDSSASKGTRAFRSG